MGCHPLVQFRVSLVLSGVAEARGFTGMLKWDRLRYKASWDILIIFFFAVTPHFCSLSLHNFLLFQEDVFSSLLIPNDIPGKPQEEGWNGKAISSCGNGNCLFNSISLLLKGKLKSFYDIIIIKVSSLSFLYQVFMYCHLFISKNTDIPTWHYFDNQAAETTYYSYTNSYCIFFYYI